MKEIIGIYGPPKGHWVGNGFPVKTLFSYDEFGEVLSPFLLLDRAGPMDFAPSKETRGVGKHPHRGFETVTIVYEGEVAHKDSTGKSGVIGPGDVQWMTAASGILHEEFHSEAFTQKGGVLDMVQLWVNLPAKNKVTPPGYQGILNQDIPVVPLKDGGKVRVIAGEFQGVTGSAAINSPLSVLDVQLSAGEQLTIPTNIGWNMGIVVLNGTVLVNAEAIARSLDLVVLSRDGHEVSIEANGDARLLVLSGEPIEEPIVGHGPFVMNSEAEISQALTDLRNGQFEKSMQGKVGSA